VEHLFKSFTRLADVRQEILRIFGGRTLDRVNGFAVDWFGEVFDVVIINLVLELQRIQVGVRFALKNSFAGFLKFRHGFAFFDSECL